MIQATQTSQKQDVQDLINKKKDCDYLEIRLEDSQRSSFRFLGKDLDSIEQNINGGAAVRALVNGCWGFTTINDISTLEGAVDKAIEAARISSQTSSEKSSLAPVDPVDVSIPLELVNDPREVSLEDKLSLFSGYNDKVLSGKGITSSGVYYFDTTRRILFANSEGTCVEKSDMDLGCSVSAISTRNGETRTARTSQGTSNDYNVALTLGAELERIIEAAPAMIDAPVIESGNYTVICDPDLAGVFVHEAFGHLSEGDNLANDKRMQEVMALGRQFGDSFLNVYDTGLDIGLRGHIAYDDEGVPTQNTRLIHEGKLVGRLHSRETAGKLGEQATGSARAISYRFAPIPRMRNTVIGAGPHGSFEDMIKDVKLGVYAIDSSGGQTNGELFTFTAQHAFMIRDGKLAERVKDVTISGNVFDTLRNIDAIGSDLHIRDSAGGCGKAGQMPLPVSHGSPHIRIQNCLIGGR